MKKENRRLYEGMYIISATLSEEARKKALERITSEIEEKGGEINKIHDLGRKRLAYEIEKKREGHYFLIYFTVATSAIDALWKEYKLHEDLIRFITLTADSVKETLEYPKIKQI